MSWTDERIELLRKLWSEGLSASQIATRIGGGITRNAVIGKVHRLGLEGRMRTGSGAPQPDAGSGIGASGIGLRRADASVVPVEPAPVAEPESDPATAKVTLLHLTEQTCKWPIGDPGTPSFHFCGQRAELGLPYCAAHARIAYQPAHDRRRDRKLSNLQ
jgi:GcrA cell cycle regulator